MRKVLMAVSAVAFVVALGAPAFAADSTVKGKLVDQACYLKDKANAAGDHGDMKDCAAMCAKKGQPVALVTEEGKIYTVTGDVAKDNNAKLVPHMTHIVELTGEVTTKDGKNSIAASNLKMISR